MAESWHALPVQDAFQRLDSGPLGLDNKEVRQRLSRYGKNELVQLRKISALKIFLSQFLDLLVVVLLVAAFLSAAIGLVQGTVEELYDAVVILVIVGFNAVFGFFQEYRAEKAIQALRALAAPQAQVIRDAQNLMVPSAEVVPGDVVLLNAGDKVPADARLFEVANLSVNEAPLTGESVAVSKGTDALVASMVLPDRRNMAYAGCVVEAGRAKGLVVATGMQTELGKIAGLVQSQPSEETPLQKQLNRLGRTLGFAVLGICAVIFLVGYLRNPAAIVPMFLTAVSLAVAAIPESLPAVVTITLALGLQRMAKRHALIRKLPAVEALGSTTVICSDKTGTLTLGEMNVRTVLADGVTFDVEGAGFSPEGRIVLAGETVPGSSRPALQKLLMCGALCNDAHLKRQGETWKSQGDSTEAALLALAMRGGLRREDLEAALPRVAEIPFSSERKMMTTIHAPLHPEQVRQFRGLPEEDRAAVLADLPGLVSFVKGAPERVLERCSRILVGGNVRPLPVAERDDLITENQDMALRGLRVLAMAYQEIEPGFAILAEETVENDLVFLGLVGMMDAPRADAITAIEECKRAGIEVVMITGDQKLTAIAVAKEMGIMAEGDQALTGAELDAIDPHDFEMEVERVRVYARVNPEHKLKIVEAFKKKGQVVAMTGDGVNDAPAMKRSDLGIAMGITGTDVAKESADMILTDDSFASIVRAVEEGRVVYDNIRKFVRYMLSTNAGEVLLIFVATLLGMPLPLIPIQILWVNLITDGFPALALGVEPEEKGVMSRGPRRPKESILSGGMGFHIVWVGVLMVVATLILYVEFLVPGMSQEELRHPRTIAFFTISLFQLFHVLAIRVWNESVFTAGFFRNRYLLGAVAIALTLQLAVIYLPPLAAAFETVPLALDEVLLCVLVASTLFWAVEAEKALRKRKPSAPVAAPAVPEAVG
jgi:Ca2+-transporting ATPase